MSRFALASTLASALATALLALACGSESPVAAPPVGGAGGEGGMGGAGGAAMLPCDMWAPRAIEPEVVIGPVGLRDRLVAAIDGATESVELMMYQLECAPCVEALIAAHQRGVAVRVSLDDAQSINQSAEQALVAAGVSTQAAPSDHEHNHAKLLIVDHDEAVVMSANMNGYSFASERNYGVIDRDLRDVAQLVAIFERDWAGDGTLDTSCTRLLISPLNSRERLLELIASAERTLDLAVMYVSDTAVKQAIVAAVGRGVAVRVLLAMPEWIDGNVATATELGAAGAETRYLYAHELHAKLIVSDGVPFVGSQNLSYTALEKNREIGLLVTEPAPAAAITAQFEADWSVGTPAP